ncbi:Uncharacterised protein [Mycobacteroides abscessus subsp. abscessus]|nr:Uncharacterised protein [Mycobacteroides abscessus subsp. abscessus]
MLNASRAASGTPGREANGASGSVMIDKQYSHAQRSAWRSSRRIRCCSGSGTGTAANRRLV